MVIASTSAEELENVHVPDSPSEKRELQAQARLTIFNLTDDYR